MTVDCKKKKERIQEKSAWHKLPLFETSITSIKYDLRLTALRTLLSRGFLLGSLVEERMPVPQLLAKVFLQGCKVNTRGQSQQQAHTVDKHGSTHNKPHCTTWPQMECESWFVTTAVVLESYTEVKPKSRNT